MFRFTIRDLLWLMVVVGLSAAWRLQVARYKALERRFDAMIEVVTSDGLIAIKKTGPDNYFVETGPVAKDLRRKAGNSEPTTSEALSPAAVTRPDANAVQMID